MISNYFREATFELAKELSRFEEVVGIVLFGSVARGEADKKSDLDLLLVLERKARKKEWNRVITQISKKHEVPIQTVVTDKKFSGLDRNFIENVAKEGIMLYGKSFEVKAEQLALEPFVLVNYDTTACSARERNGINRVLYGYTTKKEYKGKRYISGSEGILKKYQGWKAGLATIIIPFGEVKVFTKLFKESKVKCKSLEIWLPRI